MRFGDDLDLVRYGVLSALVVCRRAGDFAVRGFVVYALDAGDGNRRVGRAFGGGGEVVGGCVWREISWHVSVIGVLVPEASGRCAFAPWSVSMRGGWRADIVGYVSVRSLEWDNRTAGA